MTIVQRPLKGSRLSSFYPIKSLPSLSSLDSAFQLQEYISLLIRLDVHDVQRIVSLPGKPANNQDTGTPFEELKNEDKDSERDGKGDVTVDEPCWIYEQLRSVSLCFQVMPGLLTFGLPQTRRSRPFPPTYNHPPRRMHAQNMSRDESW